MVFQGISTGGQSSQGWSRCRSTGLLVWSHIILATFDGTSGIAEASMLLIMSDLVLMHLGCCWLLSFRGSSSLAEEWFIMCSLSLMLSYTNGY